MEQIHNKNRKSKKSILLVVVIMMAFIVMVAGVVLMNREPDPIEVMRSQLEELDSSSYSDIKEWLSDDFSVFEEKLEGLRLFIRARTTQGNILERGFLFEESLFVEWQFELDERTLAINLTYLTLEEYITKQLSELDNTSLGGITQWIEDNEGENLRIRTQKINMEGDDIRHFDMNEMEDFFVEWDFEVLSNQLTTQVNIEYLFHVRKTFVLGETFDFGGIRFTFLEDIWGGIIDNYWSLNDGQPYFAVPVVAENISYETVRIIRFGFNRFDSDGSEIILFNPGYHDVINLAGEIEPGSTAEGYLYFKYTGDGDYVVKMSHPDMVNPFRVEVIIPVSNIYIPEMEDRYNRDVPIPHVVFDLHEITLFDHVLAANSFFYTAPYTSELGNTYIILQPGEIVRDPEGVITHDSLRIRYRFYELDEERFEDGFDIVCVMETIAWNFQQGGNPATPIGDIRIHQDETLGFLQIRDGVGLDFLTRLVIVQFFPDNDEYVIFEAWLWVINEEWLEGERRAAVEEFGRLTGIDFIQILRDTYEGIDVIRERILGERN